MGRCEDWPGSAQACSNLCKKKSKQNPACIGFTFGEYALGNWFSGRCCLKAQIDERKIAKKAKHVSGAPGCVMPKKPACEAGFDYMGGDHKKRAKYRFASKTLMRILPAPVKAEVEGLIEKKTITLDLYEIL